MSGMPRCKVGRSRVSAPGNLPTRTYAGAPARALRVCSSVHPFTRTNKTPMIQAVQAAELSEAKPRIQGEMNNKTPRITEIPSVREAVRGSASAPSARMTPMTPMIQASQELAPFVAVPKTHGARKRRTPSTNETQSCQRVHAFMVTTSLIPCNAQGAEKHVGGHYLGLRYVLVNCADSNHCLSTQCKFANEVGGLVRILLIKWASKQST